MGNLELKKSMKEQKMPTTTVMHDYAAADRRSVSAYLRGQGDGRVQRYERFAKRVWEINPRIPLETVNLHFQKMYRGTGPFQAMLKESVQRTIGGLANLVIFLIFLFIVLLLQR